GNIINYALHMKKNGRAEATIKRSIEVLTALAKLCDLNNPEETKPRTRQRTPSTNLNYKTYRRAQNLNRI
ncbi:MAG: hypothetical protein NWE97_02790, partial [Candidatus Bathyarchaeota archaeon]|nr:hypothetical protein [Candidatus Bathyarchaeota archaeon]